MRNIIILITIICIAFLANADLFAQDAENVEQVSRIYNHWSSSGCIVIQGDYAYIATGLSGLQIVDISDPDNFEIVGYYDDNPNSISDVYVSSDYAYLTDHGDYNVEVRTPGGLLIVDISDPENPVEAGACEAGEWYSSIDVFVVGDYAYIGEVSRWSIGPGNLRIVDISDPENPEEISNFDTQGSLWDICVSGDYAYAAMSGEHQCSYGLLVFDVSDPTNPLRAGYYLPDWNGAESISIVDDYAYMSFHDGLHIIDISDPTNPEDLSTCEIEWPARDLSIFENHAYEIGYDWDDVYGFLRAIDVSDPTNPEQVSFYQFEGYRPERLCITNETAYVIGGNFTHYHNYHEITRRLIKLINISDPTEPEEVSVYQSGGNINDIFIAGEYAYAAAGADGLRVIDVSDSTDPVEVAVYEEAGNASSVFVSNNYAFIGDNSNIPNGGIFRVIDVSDPSNPEQTGSYQMDTFIRNMYLSGNYIYLTCYGLDRLGNSIRGSLRVIDVSDPGDPVGIGIYYDDCSCRDVFISGDYAVISMSYIEDHTARRCIRVLDVSDPTNLEEVALLNLHGGTGAVFISDDYAYVSVSNSYPDGSCNYFLSVIDISDPANPEEVNRIELPDNGSDIFVSGNYAYIAEGWQGGVRVINISDPENLEEVGYYDTPGSAEKIMVSGGMIYVADHTNVGIYRFVPDEPVIAVSPETLDFGDVTDGAREELMLAIGNWGIQDLRVSDVAVEGDCFSAAFDGEFVLESDACCELTITFEPDTISEFEGMLIITSNDPYNDELVIDLCGIGVEPGEVEDGKDNLIPDRFYLSAAYPNPFNSSTTIRYELPVHGHVSLQLYNILGQQINTMFEGFRQAGFHSVSLTVSDLPSGLYFVKLNAGGQAFTRKVMLVK